MQMQMPDITSAGNLWSVLSSNNIMAVLQLWTMTKIWKRDEILLFILHLLHSKGSYSMCSSQVKCATALLHDVFTAALGPSDNFKNLCILHRKKTVMVLFIFLCLGKMERLFSRFPWLLMHVLMSFQLQIACHSFLYTTFLSHGDWGIKRAQYMHHADCHFMQRYSSKSAACSPSPSEILM